MRRLALPALIALVLLAILVWAFMPRPVAVETATVAPRSIAVTVDEEGEARIREVFTLSAPIAGKLQRIALHAGDSVTADQSVIARMGPAAPALLDSRSRAVAEATVAAAQAAVELARAQLAQSEAALEFATSEADRSRALYERATLSKRVLDNAVLAQRTAQAAFDSATANLSVRERELDSARAVLAAGDGAAADACCVDLRAPVSGRILRVLTENEQVVQAGTPLVEIGNPGNLEVVVDLLSRDAVRVAKGAAATISGWGGAPLDALVDRIEPAAVTKVSALGIEEQRVEVILTLTGDPQAWQGLGHGFRVMASIRVWEGQGVLSIPVGALFRDGPEWATFVVVDGKARLRRITLGERNADYAQVTDGLADGDVVILHPGDTVSDGTAVQPDALP